MKDRDKMIPEHPNWKLYWLRYAQYRGQKLVLLDTELQKQCGSPSHQTQGMYVIAIGLVPCSMQEKCNNPSADHGRRIWSGDDLKLPLESLIFVPIS